MLELDGISIPLAIEVTFLRNDLIASVQRNDDVALPHALDSNNAKHHPDLIMPEIWWKK
jgi:hypothetical protein